MKPPKPQRAVAVYDPAGKPLTSKPTRRDAEHAAAILGGSNWQADGYQVWPVLIIPRHPAESEDD